MPGAQIKNEFYWLSSWLFCAIKKLHEFRNGMWVCRNLVLMIRTSSGWSYPTTDRIWLSVYRKERWLGVAFD
jgi:hypothetical protein